MTTPTSRLEAAPLGLSSEPKSVGPGKAPARYTLDVGRWYELSSNVDALVRTGTGTPTSASDRLLRPDTPILFIADVSTITVASATSAPGTVWLRREYRRG